MRVRFGRIARLSAAMAICVAPAAFGQSPPPAASVRQREQLEAARREIVAMRIRVQKRMDDLPGASESLKRVEAALKAEQDALEQQIVALHSPAPPAPNPPASPETPADPAPPPGGPPSGSPFGRIFNVSVDTRLGFDREDIFLGVINVGRGVLRPDAVKATARRLVSSTAIRVESPLSGSTSVEASVPYLYQTVRVTAPGQPARTLSGDGIGDVTLALERRLPEIGTGTSLRLAAGLQLPTGRSPFGLGAGKLPTGEGFYQPFLRASVAKMRVPLQFYGSLEYRTALDRRFDGRRVTLPDSYGGQIGFGYATGPEFITQTSVSLRKNTSPFRFAPSTTEGYLSQSLSFRPGGRDLYQGSVDVGLTEDSLDLWTGFTFRRGL